MDGFLDPRRAIWRVVRREPVLRWLEEHRAGRHNREAHLWNPIVLDEWLEQARLP